MATKKNPSVGQIIRRIRSCEVAPVYALYGGDSFLEDYFLSELSEQFLKKSEKRIQLLKDWIPDIIVRYPPIIKSG